MIWQEHLLPEVEKDAYVSKAYIQYLSCSRMVNRLSIGTRGIDTATQDICAKY